MKFDGMQKNILTYFANYTIRAIMTKPPEVSVIVPCYNMGEYIAETIDSVLAQTFQNYEIIIVDDCSSDGTTPAVIKEIAKKDKRIKPIFLKKNVKLPGARNAGITKAKAPYILPLDADDKIAPSYLEKAVHLMKGKNADIVYSHIQTFGEVQEIRYASTTPKKTLPSKNCIPVCSLFKKSAWEEFGGYDENLAGYEDWDFWLHFVEADKKFVLLDEPLFYYRVRDNSMVSESDKKQFQLINQIRKNHPNLYQGKNYDGIWGKMLFYWQYSMNHKRRLLFQIKFSKDQKIIRLFGMTFMDIK